MLVDAARDAGDEPQLGEALAKLGAYELRFGSPATSEALLSEALDIHSRTLPDTDPRTWRVLGDLAEAIAAQGRYAEAEPLVLESAERLLDLASSSASREPDPSARRTRPRRTSRSGSSGSTRVGRPRARVRGTGRRRRAGVLGWMAGTTEPADEALPGDFGAIFALTHTFVFTKTSVYTKIAVP